jgi:hypothetical protein
MSRFLTPETLVRSSLLSSAWTPALQSRDTLLRINGVVTATRPRKGKCLASEIRNEITDYKS